MKRYRAFRQYADVLKAIEVEKSKKVVMDEVQRVKDDTSVSATMDPLIAMNAYIDVLKNEKHQ